jgi:hypothetical protein
MSIDTSFKDTTETGVSQEYVEGLQAYNQSDECLDFAVPTLPETAQTQITDRQVVIQPQQTQQKEEPEVPEEFVKELVQSDEFLNSIPDKSDVNVFDVFSRFYGLVLNSKPTLHPHFDGGSTFPRAMHSLAHAIEGFMDTLDPVADAEKIEKLRKCWMAINKALGICVLDTCEQSFSKDELAKKIQKDIAEMPIGTSYVIPGGSKGHGFLYEVVRISKDKYYFTIINTGDDSITRERIRTIQKDGRISLYADKGYVTSASSLNVDFFKSIMITSTYERPAFIVLGRIDDHFAKNNAKWKHGRVHHGQSRGNCGYKSLNRYVSGFLTDALGPEKGEALYRQFKVYRTEQERNSVKNTIKDTDKGTLKRVWHAKGDEELQTKMTDMSTSYDEILVKRQKKALASKERLAKKEQEALKTPPSLWQRFTGK